MATYKGEFHAPPGPFANRAPTPMDGLGLVNGLTGDN